MKRIKCAFKPTISHPFNPNLFWFSFTSGLRNQTQRAVAASSSPSRRDRWNLSSFGFIERIHLVKSPCEAFGKAEANPGWSAFVCKPGQWPFVWCITLAMNLLIWWNCHCCVCRANLISSRHCSLPHWSSLPLIAGRNLVVNDAFWLLPHHLPPQKGSWLATESLGIVKMSLIVPVCKTDEQGFNLCYPLAVQG